MDFGQGVILFVVGGKRMFSRRKTSGLRHAIKGIGKHSGESMQTSGADPVRKMPSMIESEDLTTRNTCNKQTELRRISNKLE